MINNRTDMRKIDINNLLKSHFLAYITRTALDFPLHILDTVQLHLNFYYGMISMTLQGIPFRATKIAPDQTCKLPVGNSPKGPIWT